MSCPKVTVLISIGDYFFLCGYICSRISAMSQKRDNILKWNLQLYRIKTIVQLKKNERYTLPLKKFLIGTFLLLFMKWLLVVWMFKQTSYLVVIVVIIFQRMHGVKPVELTSFAHSKQPSTLTTLTVSWRLLNIALKMTM